MQHHCGTLILPLTLTNKTLSGLYLGNCKVWQVNTLLGHWLGVRFAML